MVFQAQYSEEPTLKGFTFISSWPTPSQKHPTQLFGRIFDYEGTVSGVMKTVHRASHTDLERAVLVKGINLLV